MHKTKYIVNLCSGFWFIVYISNNNKTIKALKVTFKIQLLKFNLSTLPVSLCYLAIL